MSKKLHPKALKTALQAHKKVWDSYPVKRDMGESTKDRPAKSMTAALTAYFDTLEKEGLVATGFPAQISGSLLVELDIPQDENVKWLDCEAVTIIRKVQP